MKSMEHLKPSPFGKKKKRERDRIIDQAVRIGDLCHEDQNLESARPCWATFGYLCAFSLLKGPFFALILQNARGQ